MLTDFNQMPAESRIWIYQSSRILSEEEADKISLETTEFLENWSSHGNELKASFQLKMNLFLIIAVDELSAAASGCSIDSSVQVVKKLEHELDLSLTDRTKIVVKNDQNIDFVAFNKVSEAVSSKKIKPNSIIFDNSITHLSQFEKNWKTTAENSWLAKYFQSAQMY